MSDIDPRSSNSENVNDSEEKSKHQEDEQSLLKLLLTTPESRILALGIVIALLYIVGLALSWLWSTEKFYVLVTMTVTNIIFGRAAGMSVGYTMELGHSIVVLISMLIETILVLLFYPLFVFSWQRLLIIPALKNIMERTSKAAEAHHEKIRKYGIIGLFVFVWSPFWMTGPVVGCAIGFLLGGNLPELSSFYCKNFYSPLNTFPEFIQPVPRKHQFLHPVRDRPFSKFPGRDI